MCSRSRGCLAASVRSEIVSRSCSARMWMVRGGDEARLRESRSSLAIYGLHIEIALKSNRRHDASTSLGFASLLCPLGRYRVA